MTIVRETYNYQANTSATTTHTVNAPSGVTAGDVLVCAIAWNGAPGTVTPGVTWTLEGHEAGASNPRVSVYSRVATGSEGSSYTFTSANSVTSGMVIARYSGVDNTTPSDATAVGSYSATAVSTFDFTGITTATNGAMVFAAVSVNSSTTTITEGSSLLTEIYEVGGKKLEADDGIQASAGDTGLQSYTFGASRACAGIVWALRPSSGGGVSVNLSTATVTANGRAITVNAPISRALNTAGITAGGQTLGVSAGDTSRVRVSWVYASLPESTNVLVNLNTAGIAAGGQVLDVVPGTKNIPLATGQTMANGQAITRDVPVNRLLDSAIINATGRIITVTPGVPPTAILLDTATLTATGRSVAVSKNVILDTAYSYTEGKTITVNAGIAPTVIPLATAGITASGQVIDQVSGAVSRALNTAGATATGRVITVSAPLPALVYVSWAEVNIPASPSKIVNLNTAAITGNGQALDVVPGAKSIILQTAAAATAGQVADIVPGAKQILTATATAQAQGRPITVNPGFAPITRNLNTAGAIATGRVITVDQGSIPPTVINLNTATISGSGQVLGVVPGARAISLGVGLATTAGQAIAVRSDTARGLATAGVVAAGQKITPMAHPVIALQTAACTALGQAIDVVPGEKSVILDTAALGATGQVIDVLPGAVVKILATAGVAASGIPVDVVPGAVTVPLTTPAVTAASGLTVSAPYPAVVWVSWAKMDLPQGQEQIVNLNTAVIQSAGQVLDVVPGGISIALASAGIAATGQTVSIDAPVSATVNLNSAVIQSAGQVLGVTAPPPGRVVSLDTAATMATSSLAIVPGAVAIPLDSGSASTGSVLAVVPGGVVIPLDSAALIGQSVLYVLVGLVVRLQTGNITAAGQDATIYSTLIKLFQYRAETNARVSGAMQSNAGISGRVESNSRVGLTGNENGRVTLTGEAGWELDTMELPLVRR